MKYLYGINAQLHVHLLFTYLAQCLHNHAHIVKIPNGPIQFTIHFIDHRIDIVHFLLVLLLHGLPNFVVAG